MLGLLGLLCLRRKKRRLLGSNVEHHDSQRPTYKKAELHADEIPLIQGKSGLDAKGAVFELPADEIHPVHPRREDKAADQEGSAKSATGSDASSIGKSAADRTDGAAD